MLSNNGVCSRREAERLIKQQKVKFKGKKLDENIMISLKELNKVEIETKNNIYDRVEQSRLRVWIYNKPMGLICSKADPAGRPTIFDQIQSQTKTKIDLEHIISIGRLDYNSEGLMILTNNGDLARQLELPSNRVSRVYRVRVFG